MAEWMTDPTDPAALLREWQRCYGDAPPLGWVLRVRLRSRWFRVHSLPDAKRYATTEDERGEVRRRQHALIADVLGEGAACWFIFGYYGEEAHLPGDVAGELRAMAPVVLTSVGPGDAGLAETCPLLVARVTWVPGVLDRVLEAVADDVLASPLLVSADLRRVVAPYDGGVDVIVETPARRAELARRYGRWK